MNSSNKLIKNSIMISKEKTRIMVEKDSREKRPHLQKLNAKVKSELFRFVCTKKKKDKEKREKISQSDKHLFTHIHCHKQTNFGLTDNGINIVDHTVVLLAILVRADDLGVVYKHRVV